MRIPWEIRYPVRYRKRLTSSLRRFPGWGAGQDPGGRRGDPTHPAPSRPFRWPFRWPFCRPSAGSASLGSDRSKGSYGGPRAARVWTQAVVVLVVACGPCFARPAKTLPPTPGGGGSAADLAHRSDLATEAAGHRRRSWADDAAGAAAPCPGRYVRRVRQGATCCPFPVPSSSAPSRSRGERSDASDRCDLGHRVKPGDSAGCGPLPRCPVAPTP